MKIFLTQWASAQKKGVFIKKKSVYYEYHDYLYVKLTMVAAFIVGRID